MPNEDELYFDNLESDDDNALNDEPNALLDDDDDGDNPPEPERRGNPAVALQAERQKRRDLEERLRETELQQARMQALLERTGGQQPDQNARNEYNQRLTEQLLENPADVLNWHQQQVEGRLTAKIAQLEAPSMVDKYARTKPAYQEVLNKVPKIREGLENMVYNSKTSGLSDDLIEDQVNQALELFAEVAGANKSAANSTAKSRLTSIHDGGQRGKGRTAEQLWAEKKALSKQGPSGANEFLKWAKSPEGLKVSAAMFQQ